MPVPTPFHPRTAALCESLRWKDWAGHFAVCSYGVLHDAEYFAIRHAAGLLDVTPLFKYEVTGPGAASFLARVMVRDIRSLGVGRVAYCPWTDEEGKTLDDGTVTRLEEERFRVTSAEPAFQWLAAHTRDFRAEVRDVTEEVGALAIQGPRSRAILMETCDGDVGSLRFFRATAGSINGQGVEITRTGYTGDLGYEVWVPREGALAVWDALMEAGRPHGLLPAGLDALDVTRIEAGFILQGVDYFSARDCLIEPQKSSPFEIGLGWAVGLEREPFLGQAALREEKHKGSSRALVGLEIDWDELERLYEHAGLPPALPCGAWRSAVPVYHGSRQVGRATSGAWSPTLKKNLALASVEARFASPGSVLRIEATVEFERRTVLARVVERPFFDPQRKRA
ncbi:MAG: aminomethyltransferase family protein [Planctomycetota bacterium]